MSIRDMGRTLLVGVIVALVSPAQGQSKAPPPSADLFEAPAITAMALAGRMAAREIRVVLFDTRTAAEFNVSHIRDAIRIEPGAAAPAEISGHLATVRNADVVLYCTIGSRSASVAIDTMDRLLAAGALHVNVLENGLIGWANADLPLVDGRGPTEFVHPFDESLVKSLSRPARARFDAPP